MSAFRAAFAAVALVILLATVFKFPWWRRALRLFIAIAATVLLLASVIGVSGPRAAIERGWLILTGGLVDVGGYRLRLACFGAGSPVVVMDAGLNQTIPTWGHVPSSVATFTRACAYDRAGLGESDHGPVPRTSRQIVGELHALLGNAGISGPYVLVGHSFGGQNVRLYASEYPGDVVGMVLVEASHEDQYVRFAALLSPNQREPYLQHEGGANDEQVDMITSGAQVREARPLPGMPLIVLTAQLATLPEDPLVAQTGYELQAQLARLVPNGKQVMVANSGHFIQLDQPQAVVDAIQEVVAAARKR
jgi:pimeloyl-ACP methyl ester carboxylesterase